MDFPSYANQFFAVVPFWAPAAGVAVLLIVGVLLRGRGAIKSTTKVDPESPEDVPTAAEFAKSADEEAQRPAIDDTEKTIESPSGKGNGHSAKTFFEILGEQLNRQATEVKFKGTLLSMDIVKAKEGVEGIALGNGLMAVPTDGAYGKITAELGTVSETSPPPEGQDESEEKPEDE